MNPLGATDKIAKIVVDLDEPADVAEFLEYVAGLLRKPKKRLTIFVQSE